MATRIALMAYAFAGCVSYRPPDIAIEPPVRSGRRALQGGALVQQRLRRGAQQPGRHVPTADAAGSLGGSGALPGGARDRSRLLRRAAEPGPGADPSASL